MFKFGLSVRHAKELANGHTLQIALPMQPLDEEMDPVRYAQACLPADLHACIREARQTSVWVLAGGNDPGDVAALLGSIVDPTGREKSLVYSLEVIVVRLSTGRRRDGSLYPVRWPAKIL